MVEFTLSMMALAPLFLGAATFGYTFYVYSKLVTAVRTGSRYASTIKYDSATTTPTSTFLTAVRKMTVYGDPDALAPAIVGFCGRRSGDGLRGARVALTLLRQHTVVVPGVPAHPSARDAPHGGHDHDAAPDVTVIEKACGILRRADG
jgi:hypothetical protein